MFQRDLNAMGAALDTRLLRAAGFLSSNLLAQCLLRTVSGHIGSTGWQIARAMNCPAKDAEKALADLVRYDLVRAEGKGLYAYYAPSREAFVLRQRMAL